MLVCSPSRVRAVLVLLLLFGAGCADPVVQYHRQFEYLVRVGAEALEEERYAPAREHLREAFRVAPLASASDLEVIDSLTQLTRACRELGRLDEAVQHANSASQILARYRLGHGGTSSGVYRVGAAYLLERGRLEIARGDLMAAEEALGDFVRVRGDDGGDERESAEAQLALGELRLARGFDEDARQLFRAGLAPARDLADRDPALLGFLLYRAAERKLERPRPEVAAALVEESRGGRAAVPPLRPGLLLMRALIDAETGSRERAAVRLEEALVLLESEEPAYTREAAAPARAIALAGALFEVPEEAEALERAVLRALAAAKSGSPLRQVLAGREAVRLGLQTSAGGAAGPGVSMMLAGRRGIQGAIAARVHDAGVEADFEIARTLETQGRLEPAVRACIRLVGASDRLSAPARSIHPQRMLECGRIGATGGNSKAARAALGRGLMLVEEAGSEPVVRIELLLRLAALAHDEGRDAEEGKLFDRVLPFVLPGIYEDLEVILVNAYSPYGRYQPSSAAARLGHVAARTYGYVVEAPQLQSLAEKLGEPPVPASRR